jgi:hypothetical protein
MVNIAAIYLAGVARSAPARKLPAGGEIVADFFPLLYVDILNAVFLRKRDTFVNVRKITAVGLATRWRGAPAGTPAASHSRRKLLGASGFFFVHQPTAFCKRNTRADICRFIAVGVARFFIRAVPEFRNREGNPSRRDFLIGRFRRNLGSHKRSVGKCRDYKRQADE